MESKTIEQTEDIPRFPKIETDNVLALARDIFNVAETMFGKEAMIEMAAAKIVYAFTKVTSDFCYGCGGQLDCDECYEYRRNTM